MNNILLEFSFFFQVRKIKINPYSQINFICEFLFPHNELKKKLNLN